MLIIALFVLIRLKQQNMFSDCKFAYTFWEDLHYWLFPIFKDLPVLTKENIICGIFMKDKTLDFLGSKHTYYSWEFFFTQE